MTSARQLPRWILGLLLGLLTLTGLSLYLGSLIFEPAARLDLPADSVSAHRPLPPSLRERLRGETSGPGPAKRWILNAEDLHAICRSSLARRHLEGRCRFDLSGETLIGEISLRLKGMLQNRYLNIDILAQSHDGGPLRIPYLRIGDARITSPLGLALVRGLLLVSPLRRYEQLRDRLLQDIHIREGRLVIVMNFDREPLLLIPEVIAEAQDLDRFERYTRALEDTLKSLNTTRFVRLGKLSRPLFALAEQRVLSGEPPIEENKAVIAVLSAYANGRDLSLLTRTPVNLPKREVLLNRRADTARHFLASALLVMSGQSTMVEMIGLAKELQDTHDGSGFSFIDLAADEAGAGFGKVATAGEAQARQVQQLLAVSEDESLYIPSLKDLPESMNPAEFERRFESIGSPAFESVRRDIRQRIRALPIYQRP